MLSAGHVLCLWPFSDHRGDILRLVDFSSGLELGGAEKASEVGAKLEGKGCSEWSEGRSLGREPSPLRQSEGQRCCR